MSEAISSIAEIHPDLDTPLYERMLDEQQESPPMKELLANLDEAHEQFVQSPTLENYAEAVELEAKVIMPADFELGEDETILETLEMFENKELDDSSLLVRKHKQNQVKFISNITAGNATAGEFISVLRSVDLHLTAHYNVEKSRDAYKKLGNKVRRLESEQNPKITFKDYARGLV